MDEIRASEPIESSHAEDNQVDKPPTSQWNDTFETNPWDTEAWLKVLGEVRKSGSVEDIRQFFERFLWQFPTSAQHWIMYLEFEISHANYSNAQDIFTRCLRQAVSVPLWKFYLDYIRRVNVGKTTETQNTIVQAYEFAIQHVGLDVESTEIWKDYIEYVKSWTPENPFEQGLQTDTLRKVYHRAVSIPMTDIESIWRDFDAYENSINKVTAKKNIGERSAAYMTARSALRDLKGVHDLIPLDNLQVPPSWNDTDKRNLRIWNTWLDWEKSNPLKYPEDSLVNARVIYAYKKATVNLRFFPSIWVDCLAYLSQQENVATEIDSLLEQALEAIPNSLLLNFFVVEMDEGRQKFEEGKMRFDTLIESLQSRLEASREDLSKVEKELALEQNNGMASMQTDQGAENEESTDDEDHEAHDQAEKLKAEEERRQKLIEPKKKGIELVEQQLNLCWIQYMKYCRRIEGLKGARQIFSRARKTDYCSYHVFVFSADMEYYCNKDKSVAFKIYEVGLKSYGDDPEYISAYMNFLINITDDANVRSLFERAVGSIPPEKSKALWTQFLEYENHYGELASVQTLTKRMDEIYPEDKWGSKRLGERYSFMNLDPILERELGISKSLTSTGGAKSAQEAAAAKARLRGNSVAEVVILPASKEEEFVHPPKKKALYSVDKGKYPRPDLDNYNTFTPDTERSTELDVLRQERRQRLHREPSPQGSVMSATSAQRVDQVPISQTLLAFFSRLPPAPMYNGPIINVDLVIDIIARAEIPIPPAYNSSDSQRMGSGSSRPLKRRR